MTARDRRTKYNVVARNRHKRQECELKSLLSPNRSATQRRFSLRTWLVFYLTAGMLLGMLGPSLWRIGRDMLSRRSRPVVILVDPSGSLTLPPTTHLLAEDFIDQAYASDGIPITTFHGKYGVPDAVTIEDENPVWRYRCADHDAMLYLDRAELDEGRFVVTDADFE